MEEKINGVEDPSREYTRVNGLAIRTEGLTKRFGELIAIDKVDLEVRRGELFGFVGPDGAGKTTMMRLLTAIMDPTSGEAWVAGHSIRSGGELLKEKIGYMSQRFGLYEDLTVIENILFYADLYGVPDRERAPRIERLLGFSNLTPFQKRLAGNLSGGMKQKLGLACALIHTPEVLFLDEPTSGVDPVSRRDFWRILYELLRDGITVFVSTSYLDEAERCTRVALIDHGRILDVDDPGRMRKKLSLPMIEIATSQGREARSVVQGISGVERVNVYGDRLHVALSEEGAMARIEAHMRDRGIPAEAIRPIEPSLEDVFISMISGSDPGKGG
ncbi:MAG TPA: multidrug ABC transporter ATP-binding protein [Deltaproteobacteria bacterium]|nr:multidrug ABC transporter ATP-binding protein [Deltaproteobacteria bacterium]